MTIQINKEAETKENNMVAHLQRIVQALPRKKRRPAWPTHPGLCLKLHVQPCWCLRCIFSQHGMQRDSVHFGLASGALHSKHALASGLPYVRGASLLRERQSILRQSGGIHTGGRLVVAFLLLLRIPSSIRVLLARNSLRLVQHWVVCVASKHGCVYYIAGSLASVDFTQHRYERFNSFQLLGRVRWCHPPETPMASHQSIQIHNQCYKPQQLAHRTIIKTGELMCLADGTRLWERFTVTAPFVKLLLRLRWTRLEVGFTLTGRFITGSETQTLWANT
jgi:hypothetical protein